MEIQEIVNYINVKLEKERYSDIYDFFYSLKLRNIPNYECGEHIIQEAVEEITGIRQNMNSYSVCFNELITWYFSGKYES